MTPTIILTLVLALVAASATTLFLRAHAEVKKLRKENRKLHREWRRAVDASMMMALTRKKEEEIIEEEDLILSPIQVHWPGMPREEGED